MIERFVMRSIDSDGDPMDYQHPVERRLFDLFSDESRMSLDDKYEDVELAETYLPIDKEEEKAANQFRPENYVPAFYVGMPKLRALRGTTYDDPHRWAVLRIHFRNWLLVEKRFPGQSRGPSLLEAGRVHYPKNSGRHSSESRNRVRPLAAHTLDELIRGAAANQPKDQARLDKLLKRQRQYFVRLEYWLKDYLAWRIRIIECYRMDSEEDVRKALRQLVMVEGLAKVTHPVERLLIETLAMLRLQEIFWAARSRILDKKSPRLPTAVENVRVTKLYVADLRQILIDYRTFLASPEGQAGPDGQAGSEGPENRDTPPERPDLPDGSN
jgi:hypothetical protein